MENNLKIGDFVVLRGYLDEEDEKNTGFLSTSGFCDN
jgi:hypothetical protein